MAYSFASIIQDATKARWSLDEVTAGLHELDFSRRFLPDGLVHVDRLEFLAESEKVLANQIRAHSYLRTFALVERFILPFVMVNAAAAMRRSSEELLALMQFGEEEAKHIALFERFAEAFEDGFGTQCEVIGPADDLAGEVLAEEPLGVALTVLHIEWMTQDHYLRSVRGSGACEASFEELLRAHWAEEAQHAKLDCLITEKLALHAGDAERSRAIETYVRVMDRLGRAFRDQVELDLEAFQRAVRPLSGAEKESWRTVQSKAYDEVFLRTGVTHRRFRDVVRRHVREDASILEDAADRWSGPGLAA